MGELDRMLTVLREAESLANELDDPRRLAWALVYGNFVHSQTGYLPEGRVLGDRALALGHRTGDTGVLVVGRYYRAQANLGADYRGAVELYGANVDTLNGELTRERYGLYGFPAVMSRGWMAWALAEQGRFEEGRKVADEGIRLAESINHPFTLCAVRWHVSHVYRIKGDLAAARDLLDRSLSGARESNIPLVGPLAQWCLGYLDMVSGRPQDAVGRIREAHETMEAMRYLLFRPLILANLAEGYRLAGRGDDARAYASQALAAAREREERGYAAYALKVLGDLWGLDDSDAQLDAAQECLGESLALADAMSMGPLSAHVHAALARLYQRRGRSSHAKDHATRAASLYRELQMPFWLERAEAGTS
jgi:tetratricopeptide (TPR) repeat protein